MREKKYANILDDFPDKIVDELKEEIEELEKNSEDKLSLTRELKFKELQEAIDIENQEIEVEEAEDLSTTEEIVVPSRMKKNEGILDKEQNELSKTQDLSSTEEKIDEELKEMDKKKKNKSNKKEIFNDDLYLTSSFKPLKKRFKLKKIFKVLFKLMFTVVLFVSLAYFVVIPLYNKYLASKPKAIFDSSITYLGDQIIKLSDLSYVDTDVFDVEYLFNVDTNVEGLENLSDNNFGFRIGVDSINKIYETSLFVEKNTEKYGYKIIEKENDIFYKFSTSDIYLKEENKDNYIDYSLIEDSINSTISHDDFNYFIKANINILKDIVTDDLFVSNRDTINIQGKEINVIRNSLELDNKSIVELEKKYSEKVLEDDRLLEISSEIYGLSIKDMTEYYQETNDYEDDYSLVLNIYSVKGNQVVGFDVEENGFRNIYYYSNNGNFDAHFNLTEDEECTDGKDCLLENQLIIDFVGIKKDGYTEVELRVNDKEVGTLDVRSFNFEKIDFTYKLIVSDIVLEGVVKIDINKEKEEYGLNFSLEFNDTYIDFDIDYKIYLDSILGSVNNEKVVEYTDSLFEEQFETLEKELNDEYILDIFDIIISVLSEPDELLKNENLFFEEMNVSA